jgi:4-hydroxybenzoate polyprenyltransferase
MTLQATDNNAIPLCVDLDNTFIRADMLHESFLALLKREPLRFFAIPLWILKGKAFLKHQMQLPYEIDYDLVPVNKSVLAHLEKEKAGGRTIILVTASPDPVAQAFKKAYPLFDEAYGSGEKHNLKGEHKSQFLESKFGVKGFDYMGDSAGDLPVWHSARKAMAVGTSRRLNRKIGNLDKHFKVPNKVWRTIPAAIRARQWVKNFLIFSPLLLAHQIGNSEAWLKSLLAFAGFSLIASGIYLLNDLGDLDTDRRHPVKKNRPLASGTLSIRTGLILFMTALLGGTVLSLNLGLLFSASVLTYVVINLVYTFYLKSVPIADVFCLSAFYTIRIWAGSFVTGIPITSWLIVFSFFLFLSLSFLKRYSDAFFILQSGRSLTTTGRSYQKEDLAILFHHGNICAYLSVLVFCLYVFQESTRALYPSSALLWLIPAVLLYWISRMWYKANKGLVKDDPVRFAVADRESILLGLLILLISIVSSLRMP